MWLVLSFAETLKRLRGRDGVQQLGQEAECESMGMGEGKYGYRDN